MKFKYTYASENRKKIIIFNEINDRHMILLKPETYNLFIGCVQP